MFQMTVDEGLRRVVATLEGGLLGKESGDFVADLEAACLKARSNGDYFHILSDFTHSSILPKNLAADGMVQAS
jgi:hypothetical protein